MSYCPKDIKKMKHTEIIERNQKKIPTASPTS